MDSALVIHRLHFAFTIYTGAYSLRVGLVWWLFGIALAIGYFTFIYRSFWGKVAMDEDGGY
jgi:cytochrome bd ubiquinol oxidase subunit II